MVSVSLFFFFYQNSHAVCDLGISIIKRLAQKEEIVSEVTLVILPSVLYRPVAKNEENPDVSKSYMDSQK